MAHVIALRSRGHRRWSPAATGTPPGVSRTARRDPSVVGAILIGPAGVRNVPVNGLPFAGRAGVGGEAEREEEGEGQSASGGHCLRPPSLTVFSDRAAGREQEAARVECEWFRLGDTSDL